MPDGLRSTGQSELSEAIGLFVRAIRVLLCVLILGGFLTFRRAIHTVVLRGLSNTTVTRSDLRPGMSVSSNGITLEVPKPGQGVGAAALLTGGGQVELSLHTGTGGTVTVHSGWVSPGMQLQATVTTNPCADGYYRLEGFKWSTTYSWWFASGSTPSNMSVSGAESSWKSAANHITNAYNNCGLADNVSATNAYKGRTSSGPNINSSGGCSSTDGKSVVGFGTLPNGYLGMTCWWISSSGPTSADVKLNKYYYRWYVSKPSSCSKMWSVNAVATHEFGHAFGLASVSETYHPSLTMSMVIYACQSSESTLGLGDVRGLEALY